MRVCWEKGVPESEVETSAYHEARRGRCLQKWKQQFTRFQLFGGQQWNAGLLWRVCVDVQKMGVDFEKLYYESETIYWERRGVRGGRTCVSSVLKNRWFSAWSDLTADGLDQKVLLRLLMVTFRVIHDPGYLARILFAGSRGVSQIQHAQF